MVSQSRSRRASPTQPLSAQAYALVALVGLAIGVGLLFFYIYQVPKFVENGSQSQIYYLLLIPWALACAAFLFGTMRSYAQLTHKQVGTALELGGPVVLFVLVLVGGVKLVPATPQTFDLTVRAHSEDGTQAMITYGRVTIDFDTDRRTQPFDSNGEANFKGVPPKFQGATLKILPQVEGYEEEWQRHKLQGNVIDLPLVAASQPVSQLIGSIVPPPANWKALRVTVDGQSGESKVDKFGRFDVQVTGSVDRIRLKIHAGSELVYDDYQTVPGPVTVSLESHRLR